jgi:hypothetical protein
LIGAAKQTEKGVETRTKREYTRHIDGSFGSCSMSAFVKDLAELGSLVTFIAFIAILAKTIGAG